MTAQGQAQTNWSFPRPYGSRSIIFVIGAALLLWYSGQRVEIGRMVTMTAEAFAVQLGLAERSQVADGLGTAIGQLFPIQLSERREISRIDGFDAADLPFLSHVEIKESRAEAINPQTMRMESRPIRTTYLVEPLGYVRHVAAKMLETLEIALWGTIVAILIGFPLALVAARNMMPIAPIRMLARATIGFCRAIPELVSALFLVIAYGFGPIAGILALGLYGAGFLGKFYADDIENADPRPQEALTAIGAGRIIMWRYAILPQVLPQYIAYTLYILDRNVRMATVIGLVGAGGIGQELKGRYDMYDYGHVGTILIAIFIVVLLLDRSAGRLRQSLL
ncbi:phosphonate ABC transporter, permease protein PhnE [Sphingobium sp. SCG-1]|uniref:phosphonate ABC transporter, permease protein PhnE n=1 Tax=Sphingobium sp. SCG-1 TaxID=2072936 RepID=UPI000CD68AD2|nr:phosphonate ABC transporter, permease protein PhnE [Sphingobium sp. SCG-1]AUW59255.1 phosphonate ABC transporter, permease protein PhnE [Sphingobium sp. SCG-1]